MASHFEEEGFFLGEKSNRMVTITPFMAKLKVHIRQFYVNEKGEKKPGKNRITLELEEFEELVKFIPKVQDSIARYELRETGIPSSPFELDLPVLDLDTVFLPSPPSQGSIAIIGDDECLTSILKCPSPPPSSLPDVPPPHVDPSLENIYDTSPKKQKEKRKRSKEIARNANKELKTENKRPSGIFVEYSKLPSEFKETTKDKRKYDVKQECIDKVASVEAMKEVDEKLWLEHYNRLCEKLLEVVRKKCTGCQTDEPNQLAHELCVLASAKEKVELCFEEAYRRVSWDEILDNWYKKVLEMPIALNPETLAVFRETVNPTDFAYKNRLRKCSFLMF